MAAKCRKRNGVIKVYPTDRTASAPGSGRRWDWWINYLRPLFCQAGESVSDTLMRADAGMYAAKHAGRITVRLC